MTGLYRSKSVFGSFGAYLPFQEAEDSCRPIVSLEREGLRVHREHTVQVAEHHVGKKAVAHEAQLV